MKMSAMVEGDLSHRYNYHGRCSVFVDVGTLQVNEPQLYDMAVHCLCMRNGYGLCGHTNYDGW